LSPPVKVSLIGKYYTGRLCYFSWKVFFIMEVADSKIKVIAGRKLVQHIRQWFRWTKLVCWIVLFSWRKMSSSRFVIVMYEQDDIGKTRESICSVLRQKYANYRLLLIRNSSLPHRPNFITSEADLGRIEIVPNPKELRSLEAKYSTIHHLCDDDEIVVSLDSKHRFAHAYVLTYLRYIYSVSSCWMTFGSFMKRSKGISEQKRYETSVIKDRTFRKMGHPTHLQTYYAWLFKAIPKSYLVDKRGKYFLTGENRAVMYSLIELAANKHVYISVPMMIYDDLPGVENGEDNHITNETRVLNKNYIKSFRPLTSICDEDSSGKLEPPLKFEETQIQQTVHRR